MTPGRSGRAGDRAGPGSALAGLWRGLPAGHRAALVATTLLALFFAVRGAGVGMRPQGTDLTIYLEAARAWSRGESPQEVRGYLYLPSFAALLAPLALLPRAAAVATWAALSLGCLTASVWIVRRLALGAGRGDTGGTELLLWAPLACILRPVDSSFANGQANLVVLAVLLAFLLELSRGRETVAASWLALAIALKVLPAVFLAYLAARRRWRCLGLALAMTAACVWGLPALTLGLGGSTEALACWWRTVLAPHVAGGRELVGVWGYAPGQSLPAALIRTLTGPPAPAGADPVNLATLDPDLVGRLATVLAALLLAAALLPVWLRRGERTVRELGLEAAVLSATAVLTAPIVHKAHMVWLLLPFAVGLRALWLDAARGWGGRLALLLAAGLVSGTAPALLGRSSASWLMRRNAVCLGALVLLAALLVLLWSRPGRGGEVSDRPRGSS